MNVYSTHLPLSHANIPIFLSQIEFSFSLLLLTISQFYSTLVHSFLSALPISFIFSISQSFILQLIVFSLPLHSSFNVFSTPLIPLILQINLYPPQAQLISSRISDIPLTTLYSPLITSSSPL